MPRGDRVIEAEAQGVHESTLADFVSRAHRLVLIRPVWASAESSVAALAKARSLVGRPDDVVPRPVEPGQLYYWGRVLYDSGAR